MKPDSESFETVFLLCSCRAAGCVTLSGIGTDGRYADRTATARCRCLWCHCLSVSCSPRSCRPTCWLGIRLSVKPTATW